MVIFSIALLGGYTIDLFFFSQIQQSSVTKSELPIVRAVNVEFSKETLDAMLDGLGKIRDQMSSVAKTAS